MSLHVETDDLTVRFGEVTAIDDLSVDLRPGVVHAMLGRNGAGKSTLLATIAGFRRPTAGTVRVDGEDPYEHRRLMNEVCLVRDHGDLVDGMTVDEVIEVAHNLRGRFDRPFADELVDRFELRRSAKVNELSRGLRSALAVSVGLATRAPLTMFDEPHLGMDAPSRYRFYEALVADYAEHPRTIVLSTHLIDEAASLFEEVVMLDRGRLLVQDAAEQLRTRGVQLTGPADAVGALVGHSEVLSERRLGGTRSVVINERLDEHARTEAVRAGVDVSPLPLQDLFVHLTDPGPLSRTGAGDHDHDHDHEEPSR